MCRPEAALLSLIMAISLVLAPALAEVNGEVVDLSVRPGESIEISDQLRGPENSGETHIYRLRVEPGVRLEVEFELRHVEFVGARISTAILSSEGGMYLGEPDVLPQGGVRRFFYSWLVGGPEAEDLLLAVSSLAGRYAPSVVNYTIRVSLSPQRDGSRVVYYTAEQSQTMSIDLGDAPSRIVEASKIAEKLPELRPGSRLVITGYLSPIFSERGEGVVKRYGGKDFEDYYAVKLSAEPGSSLKVRASPKQPQLSLLLSLQMSDGFTLNASSSPREGAPAITSIDFTDTSAPEVIYVKVAILGGEAAIASYDLELELLEPPPIKTIEEREPPVVPATQARTIVVGIAIVILALTVASAVIGKRRRRGLATRTMTPSYY